jgi:hypothetical protein
MSMMDLLQQSNERASEAIMQFAQLYPARTAGLLTRKLDELQAGAREALGLAGVIPVVLLRIAIGLAIFAALTAGVLWATLGSAAVMAGGPHVLFGLPPNMNSLPLGVLMALGNAVLTVAALGYLMHLVLPAPEARDVFGSAHFGADRDAAARAGLRRGRKDWKWP